MFSKLIRSLKGRRGPAAWIVDRSGKKCSSGVHASKFSQASTEVVSKRVIATGFGSKDVLSTDTVINENARFRGACITQSEEDWCVRIAEDAVFRCIPWSRLYLGPALQTKGTNNNPDNWGAAGGVASEVEGRDTIFLQLCLSKSYFQNMIHHEIFHVAERHMDEDQYNDVLKEFDPYAEQFDGSDYERSSIERIARSYANFACLADEGLPVLVDLDRRDILGVFSCVYTGELAKQLRYVKPELYEEDTV